MKARALLGVAVLAMCGSLGFGRALIGCAADAVTCEEDRTCVDAGGGDGTADAGGDVAPMGCDLSTEPKDSPACVDEAVGVFVSARGDDTATGTKQSPFRTIARALQKRGTRPRIYVCEGTYDEHVTIDSAADGVSLYGGFACEDWSYAERPTRIMPSDAGYALRIAGSSRESVIADLGLESSGASTDAGVVSAGASSVAVFVANSAGARFVRCAITAGEGGAGKDADAPASNWYSENPADLQGNGATGSDGGEAKTCPCKDGTTTTGGNGGGGGGAVAFGGGDGGASPAAIVTVALNNGHGGAGGASGVSNCAPGNHGADGQARDGGTGASVYGTVDSDGWHGAGGASGASGTPGQGGGGGGGAPADQGGNGGGGGGCGGCGGAGGAGGQSGGSSIAVLAFRSSVTMVDCVLRALNGADGGGGARAGGGGGGGGGNVGACGGGTGGGGAGGSGGGGGAGGVSVGVVYLGVTPVVQGGSITPARPGVGGAGGAGAAGGGTAPSGASGAAGVAGVAAAELEVN